MPIPLFLNRVGTFRVEVEAVDHNNKDRKIKMTFPVKVVDPTAVK